MSDRLLQQIKQLDSVLRKNRPRRSSLVGSKARQSKTQEQQLLTHLREAEDLNVTTLADELGHDISSPAFHVLKSSMFKRMLNSVFLLDLRPNYSEYGVAYFKNQKSVFLAKVLTYLGARSLADSVAIKGLKVAEQYELASNALEFLQILQLSTVLRGETTKFKSYHKKTKRWLAVTVAETEMFGQFNNVSLTHRKRGSSHRASREKAFIGSLAAEAAYKEHKTFQLGQLYYRMRALAYQCDDNYKQCIEVCVEAENYIRSRPEFCTPTRLAEFALKRLVCSMHIRDRENGLSAAAVCMEAFKVGSYNWFVIMEHVFLLHSTSLDLTTAREVYTRTVGTSGYYDLDDFIRERWLLYHLYMLYAEGTLKLNVRLNSKTTPAFKDFIKWTPSYRHDKTGYHTAVLILHTLFVIEKQDWKAVFERVDALRSYRLRHLADKNHQADLFVQLLLTLEPNNFERARVEAASQQLYASLQQTIDSDQAMIGVQILPFEWLWPRVLQSLK